MSSISGIGTFLFSDHCLDLSSGENFELLALCIVNIPPEYYSSSNARGDKKFKKVYPQILPLVHTPGTHAGGLQEHLPLTFFNGRNSPGK